MSEYPNEPGGGRVSDSQLAVLLRQTQWALDEAAHDVGAGRATPQGREDLADSLEALAAMVRASAAQDISAGPERHPETTNGPVSGERTRPFSCERDVHQSRSRTALNERSADTPLRSPDAALAAEDVHATSAYL
ncbi:MAG: hypothetical protein ACRDRV_13005 [Pseudonocardiaceae bacterium]